MSLEKILTNGVDPLAHAVARYTPATYAAVGAYGLGPELVGLIGAYSIPGAVIATSIGLGYIGLKLGYIAGDLLYRIFKNTIKYALHPIKGLEEFGKNILHPIASLEKIYNTIKRSNNEPYKIIKGLARNLIVAPIILITDSARLLLKTEAYQQT